MTRKNVIMAALISVTAIGGGAVVAQTVANKGPMRADTNGDGSVSRAEFVAAAEARFAARDANSDKVLAAAELGERAGRAKRQDTNNDGSISLAEATATATAMFQRLDANGDGKLEAGEMRQRHGKRGHRAMAPDGEARPAPGRGGGLGAMALMRADTNGDGRISREEHRAQSDQRFDRMDANRDGFVDQAELQSQRGAGMRGGRRGWGGQGVNDMPPPPPPPPPAPAK